MNKLLGAFLRYLETVINSRKGIIAALSNVLVFASVSEHSFVGL